MDTTAYINALPPTEKAIAELLAREINACLPDAENRVWHGHPVWFLEGNPVVGFDKSKTGLRLLFWSGQTFDEPALAHDGKFKAAGIRYTSADQVRVKDLSRWLAKARDIQWDYQNLVRRKGVLERLK